MQSRIYRVNRIQPAHLNEVDFNLATPGSLDYARPESSSHRPRTRFALLHDMRQLYLRFTVDDCFIRVVQQGFQVPVHKDSCMEFFVQPHRNYGYFNFEFNAGGAMQTRYVEDHARTPQGFKKSTPLPIELGQQIEIYHSLPALIEPEITTPMQWTLTAGIPLTVMSAFGVPVKTVPGTRWRGNFYKCADDCSHPHWLSWSPVPEVNFHLPQCFGELYFE